MSVDSSASSEAVDRPNDPDTSNSHDVERTEQAAAPQPGSGDTRGPQRTETLTREEYADEVRAGGQPIKDSRDGHEGVDSNESRRQANTEDERPADDGPPGTHDLEAHDTGTRTDSGEPEHAVRAAADPLTREEYADAVRGSGAHSQDLEAGHQPDGSDAVPVVTHFHGEFKDRPLDLYTDGTRWAAADAPDMDETVSKKGDMPDRLPTGKELVEGAGEGSSLLERLRREVYEESEDETDNLEKEANLVHDVFARPPTGSHEGTAPSQSYIHGAQHSGIDAGSMAVAVFTLGLVIDRSARWVMQHYENHAKGR